MCSKVGVHVFKSWCACVQKWAHLSWCFALFSFLNADVKATLTPICAAGSCCSNVSMSASQVFGDCVISRPACECWSRVRSVASLAECPGVEEEWRARMAPLCGLQRPSCRASVLCALSFLCCCYVCFLLCFLLYLCVLILVCSFVCVVGGAVAKYGADVTAMCMNAHNQSSSKWRKPSSTNPQACSAE